MGAKYLGSYVGMARPILAERDYQAVKRLLVDRCKGIYVLLEAERFEALIRELTLYEDHSGGRDESRAHLGRASTTHEQLAAPALVRPALSPVAATLTSSMRRNLHAQAGPGSGEPGAAFIVLLQSLTPSVPGTRMGPQ